MDAGTLLARGRRVLVLTGAGVSTESGVPDFRGPDGVWSRFDPGEFEIGRLLRDPARFWTMRARLMEAFRLDAARPNAAHEALAAAARSERLLGVVTQNVDGLHAAAGTPPERLVEVHGVASHVRCMSCGWRATYGEVREAAERGAVRCPSCGGIVKPDVVLFGEALPAEALARAEDWARTCDVLLAVGSSLSVWPVAGLALLAKDAGAALVLVNDGPTEMDALADARVDGRAAEVLPPLLRHAGLLS